MFRSKSNSRLQGGYYAVLDIGTTKIACFIAHIDAAGEIQIRGIGHQWAKGIRASVITDFAEAETSIIAAVHAAEQMAGETIENVIVSITSGGLASRSLSVEMDLLGQEVTERDIMDILEQGQRSVATDDNEIIHCFPVSYYLDEAKGIADPRQMFGKRLGADLHILTASGSMRRNIAHCIARCHLNAVDYVVASHASGLACLDEDEKQLGVTVIDMGGGSTSFAVFHGGRNVYADVIPIGGAHVTNDLAKGLSTSVAHAERLKTIHGSCMQAANDYQVMINVPQLGEDEENEEGNTVPRSLLVSVIRPRIEEVFEMVKNHIEASGMEPLAGRRIVITGGASQLIGIRELAARTFGRQVRLAKPRGITGVAEAVSGPAFATSLGMLRYMVDKPMEQRLLEEATASNGMGGRLKKAVGWFKENF